MYIVYRYVHSTYMYTRPAEFVCVVYKSWTAGLFAVRCCVFHFEVTNRINFNLNLIHLEGILFSRSLDRIRTLIACNWYLCVCVKLSVYDVLYLFIVSCAVCGTLKHSIERYWNTVQRVFNIAFIHTYCI